MNIEKQEFGLFLKILYDGLILINIVGARLKKLTYKFPE